MNLVKSTKSHLIALLCEKEICYFQFDKNDHQNKLISLSNKRLEFVNKIYDEAKLQVKLALDLMSDEEQVRVPVEKEKCRLINL